MQLQDDYFAAYGTLKLTRDAGGVLVVEFHTKGGPLRFTAQGYTELVDAFYRIARDRENKIDIPTGGRGEFIGPDGPGDHSKIWRDANLIFDRASFCRIHGSWSFLPTGEGDYWSSDL
jgi:PAS domain S-box-containing protein